MRYLGLIFILAMLFACSEYNVTQGEVVEFKNLDFDYSDNMMEQQFDEEAVQLGRVLFYDNILSKNGNVSCASCHKQEFAFSDDVAFSIGFLDGETFRNTPTLINNQFNTTFFWDGRASRLEQAVALPIFDHNEMGMSESDLIQRINNAEYYDDLIMDAFGRPDISRHDISFALAQFVGSIISIDSRLDKFMKDRSDDILDKDEHAGLELFETHCNTCHSALGERVDNGQTQVVSDDPYMGTGSRSLVDIGLPVDFTGTRDTRVRIPSLRNLSKTAPYMHDGRFETIREVIDHYNDDIEDRPTLDSRLKDQFGQVVDMNMTEKEKDQLEKFLLTLRDTRVETDERWSDPFVR